MNPPTAARDRTARLHRHRWFGLVLAGLLLPAMAPADCRPVSPADSLPRSAKPFSRGLLWKIEKPGLAPSHLFGTIHIGDPRVVQLPCPIEDAFTRSASFTMELIMNGAGLVSMAEAMFFADGTTLRQTLGEQLYQETLSSIGSAGSSPDSLNRMKPWAIVMMLSTPAPGGGLFLDLALQVQATRLGIPTFGLETMKEQIAVFDGLSIDDQVALLRDTIRGRQTMAAMMEELTDAYLRRDLDALVTLSEKYQPPDSRAHRTLMDRLLTQRNRNMAQRMEERLRDGHAFIAVGALHLPGRHGLLHLLTDAGYRVSAIY